MINGAQPVATELAMSDRADSIRPHATGSPGRPIRPDAQAGEAAACGSRSLKVLEERFRALGSSLLSETVADRDVSGRFDRTLWKRAAQTGLFGLHLPASSGGSNWNALEAIAAFEGFAHGCQDAGFLVSTIAHVGLVESVIHAFGTPEQKKRWLPGLVDGSLLGCFAVTERQGGSDVRRLRLAAAPQKDGSWMLSGEKWCVTNAPTADVAVTFARCGTQRERITAFIVDLKQPGVKVSPPFDHVGIRTAPAGSITFDNCHADAAAVLGEIGQGLRILNMGFTIERILTGIAVAGGLRTLIDLSLSWARYRRSAGRTIGSFQHVQSHVVEMAASRELVRCAALHALQLWLGGADCSLLASVVKMTAAEAFLKASTAALRVHGNHAYARGGVIERFCRDAAGILLAGGTAEVHKNTIWRELVRMAGVQSRRSFGTSKVPSTFQSRSGAS